MTIEEIRAELAKQGMVAIIWSIGDVQSLRENLTDAESLEVLQKVERDHDAMSGVNWDTLEEVADRLFPDSDDREVEADADANQFKCGICGHASDEEFDNCPNCGAPLDTSWRGGFA